MTKEELEKEASVYANAIERKASKEIVQIAYIDAAEPREKRIAELEKEIAELEAQIEKMKRCSNCKYFYCPTSYKIEKDGKVLFHNWNKEKQAYCDCGNLEGEKYQLWEIKEK